MTVRQVILIESYNMRMESRKPRRKRRKWLPYVVLLILVGLAIIYLRWDGFLRSKDANSDVQPVSKDENATSEGQVREAGKAPRDDKSDAEPAPGPKGITKGLSRLIGPSPITQSISPELAKQRLEKGLKLYAQGKDLLTARKLLNQAYMFGRLSEPQAITVRKALEDLANRTILRRDTYVNPKDPYTVSHTFKLGDRLLSDRDRGVVTKKGIIPRYNLNVPHRIITWVNGLESSTQFKADVSYKLLKGPFHVVAYKGKFVADIYLQDLFLRRIPICIGAPETPTPEGFFRIPTGGKSPNSTYYPPAETGGTKTAILPGEKDYPLGPRGLNIKIEGIVDLGTNIRVTQSYSIHGTNDPGTIGAAVSRGCIRLRNEDIRFLYSALQDYADPNDTRATWTRWSTITVRP